MSAKPRPEWADRLERLRATLGISQAGLAKRLHVSAMAPSRWERGINEPPAEIYIQLGKMVGEPACWYFWEKAGLKKSDVLAATGKKAGTGRTGTRSGRNGETVEAPLMQIIPSAKLRKTRAVTAMCAIPLYGVSHSGGAAHIDREAGEVVVAPKSWCEHPDETFCIRQSGEKMAPVLRDGYVIAVDKLQTDTSKLDGKMVLASHSEKGLLVNYYQRMGKSEMLVPENRDHAPIYLAEGGWTILGKVIWWLAKAP
jgi:SOS-response transcriptional repressor LexA